MNGSSGNVFKGIPKSIKDELFEDILTGKNFKIERIVSEGHRSPESGWYDQEQSEWVIVLEGSGRILYEDGSEFLLEKGGYLNIPSRTKHKVIWTDPSKQTVWLAVHYS
ncbi:MAG: cupin domain-containing protein [Lentisphaeraceae bacterium]|nr:cupin domain-containing protein [Lentisphaeraceae bacterium]